MMTTKILEKILIVEDEKNTREGLKKALTFDYHIVLAEDANKALELLNTQNFDIILTDMKMPGMDGVEFVRRVMSSTLEPKPICIMLTAYGSVETAVNAMKAGATDFLTKPVDLDNLDRTLNRALETRNLKKENKILKQRLDKKYQMNQIIGHSKAMENIFEIIAQIAPAKSTVLLTGESGTGKELFAQAIHQQSPRADKPFITVHCASLNPNLLESELFGHEKGAFTGASEMRKGRFESADGGTIFLDEIGEIDSSTQVKLLRVLETMTFERVGSIESLKVDIRIIAATNKDLKEMVKEGTFREDLYYRLDVLNVKLPSLRERKEDIHLLLNHFLEQFCEENAKNIEGFSHDCLKVLVEYPWPGNVRELRNCVERMTVLSKDKILTIKNIPAHITSSPVELSAISSYDMGSNEKGLIYKALEECGGNKSRAAKMLGISRRTLHRKLAVWEEN